MSQIHTTGHTSQALDIAPVTFYCFFFYLVADSWIPVSFSCTLCIIVSYHRMWIFRVCE